jgi:hypothetical protein
MRGAKLRLALGRFGLLLQSGKRISIAFGHGRGHTANASRVGVGPIVGLLRLRCHLQGDALFDELCRTLRLYGRDYGADLAREKYVRNFRLVQNGFPGQVQIYFLRPLQYLIPIDW